MLFPIIPIVDGFPHPVERCIIVNKIVVVASEDAFHSFQSIYSSALEVSSTWILRIASSNRFGSSSKSKASFIKDSIDAVVSRISIWMGNTIHSSAS